MKEKQEGAQFVRYFGPVLDALRSLGGSGSPSEVKDKIAEDLKISDEKQNEHIESGQSQYSNQVSWARFYLIKEGLLDSPRRGLWRLTEEGLKKKLSLQESKEICAKWVKFYAGQRQKEKPSNAHEEDEGNLEPRSETSHRTRLLELIKSLSPSGFERLCQRLLREAGFKQVEITGRPGDGGIDGIGLLEVNPLVTLKVLFQCKRYDGAVSPSQVRDFRGTMGGRTDKGIIITTGTFTSEARKEAIRDGVPHIELVDGEKLLDMFEDYKLGLKAVTAFEVDEKFFDDFKDEVGAKD